MSEEKNAQEPTAESGRGHDEAIARLLRLAGPRPPVPDDREARVRAAVHEHWRSTVKGRRRLRWAAWITVSLAAASVLVFIPGPGGWRALGILPLPGSPVGTLIRLDGSLRISTREVPVIGAPFFPGTDLETGATDRAALRLVGGATVRVDSETRLRLISESILALDRGALYLDSGSGNKTPSALEIRTRLGTVRHIGTQFEVRLERMLQVTVREGIARLERAERSYDTRAGIQLSVGSGGDVTERNVPLHGPRWDWILSVAPEIQIEGRPLGEFLEWVARENGWRVEFTDASIATDAATVILHGSIAGLRPDQAPAAVLPTCGLRHRVEGDTIFIDRADRKDVR
jgi:ferric-dicitrate binding protein FerR (iron transport regulator)